MEEKRRDLNLLAFDCGNSSVRTILCRYDGEKVMGEVILQEPNRIIEEDGVFYWDMPEIFSIMKRGLGMAAKKADRIDSVGICTWGVDFQMVDGNGNLVERALCYRNSIGHAAASALTPEQQKDMFCRTGILCDKINTIFMLKGLHERTSAILEKGKKILLVPDIFVYLFTGVLMNEPSELSTTQLLDVQTMTIDKEQCAYAGISPEIFSEIGVHGKKVGNIRREILEELGITYEIPLVCVPSHDTACAVLAIPSLQEKYLFVSSGTWALVGAQCPQPVISEAVLEAKLTNEAGAFGRTTLLRNHAGMFLVQRLKTEYEEETGEKIGWSEFTGMADEWKEEPVLFDVNDIRLFNPDKMAAQIREMIREAEGAGPDAERSGWPKLLHSLYVSLGTSFAQVLERVAECTGDTYDRVYIVGGGSKNAMINRTCAERLGLPVYACDMECSSVGNAVSQLAYHLPELTYEELRGIITRSLQTKVYQPSGNGEA